jgi:hypothetical protein
MDLTQCLGSRRISPGSQSSTTGTTSSVHVEFPASVVCEWNGAHMRSTEVTALCDEVYGTRVTSRWVLTGTNNGTLGTEPNSKPIAMTGTAVWTVDEEGKLQRGWVEQASFELYHRLPAK